MGINIVGIQQIGIGVEDVYAGFKWYRENFGMDIEIFDEKAVAEFMLHYTEGLPRERHAILALNMLGGGGFEIWQHTGKKPQKSHRDIHLGDIGINVCKIKTVNLKQAFDDFQQKKVEILGKMMDSPGGCKCFFVRDPWDNIFQVVEEADKFHKGTSKNGGVYGTIIGVSNIEKSLKVYQDLLDYDQIVYDKTGVFDDFGTIDGSGEKMRRVLLTHSKPRRGAFSQFFGPTQIELVQLINRTPEIIYKGRIWGDPGFIHICFDITGFDDLKQKCKEAGFPFTVDSASQIEGGNSFDMGDAAGHFGYISDPDGIPIEFVETHKIPIIEKLNISLNLSKRNPDKPLPRWILKALAFKRKK
ncbi:MAG: VOC family protein [Bacteroidales bacterium]|nr:VOC family protein [Bacteroidales bacterium]